MICIHCGNTKTNVVNSRPHKKRPSVWRRRSCDNCNRVFTTMEVTDLSDQLEVHYPNKSPSKFSLPQLALSLTAVLINRPDHADDAFWLAQTIAEQLYQSQKRPITPTSIAQAAYEILDRYDPAAALQYGARYGVIESSIRRRSIRRKTS